MTFQTEFPKYPAADMPAIPAGFEDCSWRNDTCPSFINEADGMLLWVDYADPSQREHEVPRFGLTEYDDGIGDEILVTDNWSEILAAIDSRRK